MKGSVTTRLRGREGLLLAGDLVCVLIFALLGLRSHEDGITPESVARAALPFQAGWLFTYVLLAPHVQHERPTRQVVRLWVPAWAIGLVLRTLLFDRTFAVTFAIVALLVIGGLLMLWRGLLAPLALRGTRD